MVKNKQSTKEREEKTVGQRNGEETEVDEMMRFKWRTNLYFRCVLCVFGKIAKLKIYTNYG